MAPRMTNRNKAAAIVGLLGFLGFVIYAEELFVQLFRERAVSLEREQTRQALSLARARLETELYRNTFLSDSLASFITMDPDVTESRWQSVARKLFEKSDTLRNVGIAPNDVISHIYPVKGNEKALGLDFRTRPDQMRTVQKARELQSVYIDGPLELAQGGSALIARFPIFRDSPDNTDYWGTVSVVMRFDALLAHSGLDAVEGVRVALSRQDLESGEYEVFYGDPAVFEAPDIQLPVNMPSGVWLLAAHYTTETPPGLSMAIAIIRTIAAVVTLLVLASILLLYRAYRYSRQAALIDELTRIPNRRFVMGLLHRLVHRRSRPASFTLLLIDLNRFKEVNDTLGHEAGDALLVHVATQLQDAVRSADTVARLGGDEFMVVLHRLADQEQVEKVVGKICEQVEGVPLEWRGERIPPSISVGYAVCYGQDTSVKELMARADERMYRKKRARLEVISPWR